jgi:sugar lactone lactonase YvrE
MAMVRSSTLLVLVLGACGGSSHDVCDDPGTACVWAGTGERGFNIKNPTAHRLDSKLYYPEDVTFGPDGRAYIVDWNNHRIRRVEPDDSLVTVIGTDYEGDGPPGEVDRLPECNPPGTLGTNVALNHPSDVEFGPDGLLYLAAWHNNKIRVFDPATGMVKVLAGAGYGFKGDNGPACSALFNQPKAIAFAPDNTLYTIDQRNVRIRAIQPDAERTITTTANILGVYGHEGDGADALNARFGFDLGTTPKPSGALVYDNNTLYIADSENNRIRRIDMSTNIIDCIAGKLEAGYSGDGGAAIDAQLNYPSDIELGPDGRLYVADRFNHVIRAMDLVTGTIETVAGTGQMCDVEDAGGCPDELPARQVGLKEPYGIAFDAAGNLYIADTHNSRILRVAR